SAFAEYWQDLRSHMVLRGLRTPKPHRETWQIAPPDSSVHPVTGTKCDECGAAFAPDQMRCQYCRTPRAIDPLGHKLLSIVREDPAILHEEWKAKLAQSGLSKSTLLEDVSDDFFDVLKEIFL